LTVEGHFGFSMKLVRDLPIRELKGHETINPVYLETLRKQIEADGVLKRPIAVDQATHVVLDGHHRLEALKKLGCSKIPVYFVDYESPLIEVHPWREGERVSKEMVIQAGLTGHTLPPKTTRHMVRLSQRLVHISHIQKIINVPLEKLR